MKVSEIKTNPNNPRLIKDDKFKKLVKSIQDFPKMMELRPIIVDDDGVILGGNMRYKAIKELKIKEIPDTWVKNASDFTEEQKKEFMIKDNVGFGEWDFSECDFDLDGMADWGLDDSLFKKEKVFNTNEDDVPKDVNNITKEGNIWLLGKHKLLCGDCTNSNNFSRLFGSEAVDMLLTDPPYGVDYVNKNKFVHKTKWVNKNLKSNHKLNIVTDNILNDKIKNYREFFINFLTPIIFKNYNTCYIFMANKNIHNLRLAFDESGYTWSSNLIWLKNCFVFGRQDYHHTFEPILYGWKTKHKFYGDRKCKDLIEFDRPQKNPLHPTTKPVGLLEILINHGTAKNMLVYDPFLGSGSTLIACEKTDRYCYGIELSPHYCDVVVKRWEEFTGKRGVLWESNEE